MTLSYALKEAGLCFAYVCQRLSRLGVGEENDKVNGVSIPNGDTHLRIVLEAANPRTVSGAMK